MSSARPLGQPPRQAVVQLDARGALAGQQRPDAEKFVDDPLLLLPVDVVQFDRRAAARGGPARGSIARARRRRRPGSRLATRMAALRKPALVVFLVVMLLALLR